MDSQPRTRRESARRGYQLRVEIIGVAGAGKTTLLRALTQQNALIDAVFHYGSVQAIPSYLRAAGELLPPLLADVSQGGRYTAQELKWMMRVGASAHIAHRQPVVPNRTTVIDQGPIYTLARLIDGKCTRRKGGKFMDWWLASLKQTATLLDLVIWLDAPTEVLLQRIYARDKRHVAKEMPEGEARAVLTNMHALFQLTMTRLREQGYNRIMIWDTSTASIEEIAEETARTLGFEAKRAHA
jgi:thymidylate kinase